MCDENIEQKREKIFLWANLKLLPFPRKKKRREFGVYLTGNKDRAQKVIYEQKNISIENY